MVASYSPAIRQPKPFAEASVKTVHKDMKRAVAIGNDRSPTTTFVQVAGRAQRVDANDLRSVMRGHISILRREGMEELATPPMEYRKANTLASLCSRRGVKPLPLYGD